MCAWAPEPMMTHVIDEQDLHYNDLSFYVFFDLRLNRRLSKQSRPRWLETPMRSLWRHCNGCDRWACRRPPSCSAQLDEAQWPTFCRRHFQMFVLFPGSSTDDTSDLFKVMVRCPQATSHLNQWWPCSLPRACFTEPVRDTPLTFITVPVDVLTKMLCHKCRLEDVYVKYHWSLMVWGLFVCMMTSSNVSKWNIYQIEKQHFQHCWISPTCKNNEIVLKKIQINNETNQLT